MKNQYLEAGRIINTHGIRGEVKVEPWTNSPRDLSFFRHFYIDGKPFRSVSSRVHRNFVILALEGISDIDSAIKLKNKIIYIDRDEASLSEGEYFLQDIIGLRVVDEESGAEIGTLTEVLDLPSSTVYVVKGEREILIPAVPEFIKIVDIEGGTVTVRLIEGM